MTAREIRRAYLEFMTNKGHLVVPRANLVPQGDPTTLFTGSGMQPMIPYLLGEKYPNDTKRIVNSQVVFRTGDLEEVGDSEHLTSFEMLGNWSLGDYYKSDQISWIAEFLFDIVKLDPKKVYVTCYIGSTRFDIPKDIDAISLWTKEFQCRGVEAKVVELGSCENGDKLGMQGGRIFLYDGKENWWSRGGDESGTPIGDPCGPDSEMFYDFGEEYHDEAKWGKAHPASGSPRFTEIGNNVFMGYRKTDTGFDALEKPNIDHGAGLERLAMASIGKPDVAITDLTMPLLMELERITGKNQSDYARQFRIISDHIKSAYWLVTDGVSPSNNEQGYVLRRLIRRAIRFALELGLTQNLCTQLSPVVRDIYGEDFPEITDSFDNTIQILDKEERSFRKTLQKGLKELDKLSKNSQHPDKIITGYDVFKLHDTYGFPKELTIEECSLTGIELSVDWQKQFESAMQEQKNRSRTATKGQFKGGLGGQSLTHKKYHTATHLMYQALRDVLGTHVIQRGSNITEERLRFDFSHPEKVTKQQLEQVENIVNEQISRDLKVSWDEYPTDLATGELGALGQFGDRYGDTVKVYKMIDDDAEKPFSFEICGGPHVEHTLQLIGEGKCFKILKEESSSAGVRRIKAIIN